MKIGIDGMKCEKCAGRVKKALIALGSADAEVSLEKKEATATFPLGVDVKAVRDAVEALGFKVTAVA